MTGKEVQAERFEKLIDELIEKNYEYADALEGFRYWSDDQSFRTVYYYLVCIINFLKDRNKSVEDLKLDDWTRYAAKQKKFSSSNQITKYSAIKRFAEYLEASERLENNFMAKAKRPKFVETKEQIDKREQKILTPAEIQKVIKDIEYGISNHRKLWFQEEYRSRDMAIVLLFLSTGIRGSALQYLNVEDIDLDEGIITVTDKGDKVNEHNLPDTTIIILEKWLIKREELLKQKGKENEHALFISNQRKRMSYSSINNVVCKYCSNVTGRQITPHVLRATYGTILYNKTHDIEFVRQQMNHNSIETTKRYIRGNGKENRKKAADIMGGIIDRSTKKSESLFDTEDEQFSSSISFNDKDEDDEFIVTEIEEDEEDDYL